MVEEVALEFVRLAWIAGQTIKPLSASDVQALRQLAAPGEVLQFFHLTDVIPEPLLHQGVYLYGAAETAELSISHTPGYDLRPHGYLVLATTYYGDAYALDVNGLGGEAPGTVLLFPPGEIYSDRTGDEVAMFGLPVAASFGEFVRAWLEGSLVTSFDVH